MPTNNQHNTAKRLRHGNNTQDSETKDDDENILQGRPNNAQVVVRQPNIAPPPMQIPRADPQDTNRSQRKARGPAAAARMIVTEVVESLPDTVKNFLLDISKKFNALKSRERQCMATSAKFEEEDFIPHSA